MSIESGIMFTYHIIIDRNTAANYLTSDAKSTTKTQHGQFTNNELKVLFERFFIITVT